MQNHRGFNKYILKHGNGTIAILLAIIIVILLTATAPAVGLTWDEPAYISASHEYSAWFALLGKDPIRAFDSDSITTYWTSNHEHPPVQKILSGIVWRAARLVFDDLTASRFASILLAGLLAALLFLLVSGIYGKVAGLFATAVLFSMPRFFFHAHLTALDVPVTVSTLGLIYLFWKTVDRKGWYWGIIWGVTWGLSTSIKENAILVPFAFLIWCLFFHRDRSLILRFFIMGVVAVMTFFAVWPWMYHQTGSRLLEYISFVVDHFQIGQWYLGQWFRPPPWHFVFVMLWAVVPLTVWPFIVTGVMQSGDGKKDRGLSWLLIISIVVLILPFLVGATLFYDNERFFMPVFPLLAALAGMGFNHFFISIKKLAARFKKPDLSIPVIIILGIAFLLPQVITMTKLFPHLLSYYSEGVGGLRGATKLGLETTYWCETYGAALPYINAQAKPGDVIWVENSSVEVLLTYQKMGFLRQDVSIVTPYNEQSFLNSDWFIFQYRQSQFGKDGIEGYMPWKVLNTQFSVFELDYQGIPLMKLYGALK